MHGHSWWQWKFLKNSKVIWFLILKNSCLLLRNDLNPFCSVTVDDSGNLCAQITNDLEKKSCKKSSAMCIFVWAHIFHDILLSRKVRIRDINYQFEYLFLLKKVWLSSWYFILLTTHYSVADQARKLEHQKYLLKKIALFLKLFLYLIYF